MKRLLCLILSLGLSLSAFSGLAARPDRDEEYDESDHIIRQDRELELRPVDELYPSKKTDPRENEEYDESKYIIKQDRTLELRPVEELYPDEKPQLFGYDVIDNTEYTEETAPSMQLQSYPQTPHFAAAANATNLVTEPNFSMTDGFSEYISPYSGEMSLKFDDLSLSGVNGLDFNIGRIYQTNQALLGSKYYDPETGKQIYDYSTYLQDRFNLGSGWSFSLPSVEVYGDPDDDPELYYHTGNGNVYRVNFYGNTNSNLEGYYAEDMIFKNDRNSTAHPDISNARFYVQLANGTRQFFGREGRLIRVVDRFDNALYYSYTQRPVSNIVPNGLFEYSENVGLWTQSNSNIMNYNVDGYMQYYSSSTSTAYSQSTYIPVEPGEDYALNAWLNFGSGLADEYTGTVKITVSYYNQAKTSYYATAEYSQSFNKPAAGWQKVSLNLSIPDNRYYVKIRLENTGAKGKMAFDNVCMDKKRYVLSRIADDAGRYAHFDYGKYLYDKDVSPNYEDVTVSIGSSNPSAPAERVFRYHRHRIECVWTKYTPSGTSYNEISYYWTLAQYSENNQLKQWYEYTSDGVGMPEYYSFTNSTKNTAIDGKVTFRPLITAAIINNTKFKYGYSKTAKWLGSTGYYETNRISSRKLYYWTNDAWGTTAYNNSTYTFYNDSNGTNGNNETGYPYAYDPEYPFHTKITDGAGLDTTYYWEGNKVVQKVTSDSISGTTIAEGYQYDDAFLPDYVTDIHTTTTSGSTTIDTYKEINYNIWGGVYSETLPMTLAEKNGSNKSKFTTTYNYWSSGNLAILNAPSSVTWYPDIDKPSVSETRTFDTQGRITSFTNANGEKTEYDYTGSELAWMPRFITVSDVNNFDLLNYQHKVEYSNWYQKVYPRRIYEYGENGNNRQKRYEYNRFYDTISWYRDENAEYTDYYYDDLGRPFYTLYPSAQGVDGEMYIVDKYEYDVDFVTSQYSNRNLYKITNTRWNYEDYYYDGNGDGEDDYNTPGSLIKTSESYLDDYGNTMLNRVKSSGSSYISKKFEYDTALRLSKFTDWNGNYVTYAYDELGRNTAQTNMAGGVNNTVYGTNTIEKYFTPSGGSAENHVLKTYDIRGNLTSVKTYPNGRSAAAITQSYVCDLMGNVKAFTDGKGKITNFEYNALNQRTRVKYPETAVGEYNTTLYAKNGNATFDKQFNGDESHSVANMYNAYNFLMFRADFGTNVPMQMESYSYVPIGKISKKIDKNGNATSYGYDNAQNLTSSETADDRINYYYSPFGNITLYDYTGHSTLEKGEDFFGRINSRTEGTFTTNYAYDNNGNLDYQTDPFNLMTDYTYNNLNQLDYLTAGGKTFDYEYYPDGMLKKITYPNNVYTEYQYDNANRVTSVITKQGTITKSSYTYGYDNNGNITSENSTSYSYDARNRLSTPAIDYYGNRTAYEYNGINRLVNDGTNEYTYDKNGNTLTKGNKSFAYDKRNKMISSIASGVTTNYTYNAEGLRTDKGDTHYHLNEAGNVIAESQGDSVTAQIIWGDRPLARKMGSAWYYYIYNAHGDVVALMNESGTFVNTYVYDAWGNTLPQTTEAVSNPIKYAGEYHDSETGLYYLRNRYYDPTTGRFTQEDPTRDGDNWYVYCNNNPINNIDPFGLKYYSLRELVDTYTPGSKIFWHDETKTAILENGVFYSAIPGSTTFIDKTDNKMYIWIPDDCQMPSSYLFAPGNDTVTDEGWMIIAAAAGGVVAVKGGILIAGALGQLSTNKVAEQIAKADRIGSAQQTNIYHRAGSYLTQEQLKLGQTFPITGNDGASYTLLQVAGEVNGKSGVFEYIVNSAGQVTHQLFKAGGTVNGIINK